VADQVVLDMVREAVVAAKAAGGGFVLDGIPRNMYQARATYLIGSHATAQPYRPSIRNSLNCRSVH
jgi:adenylate kinase family enzyme